VNAIDKAHDLRCVDGDFAAGRPLGMRCLDGVNCSWVNSDDDGLGCDDPPFTAGDLLAECFAEGEI
jgi:hypothetical protein